MNCPICNKKMKIMCRPDAILLPDGRETVEALGRCEECNYDALWNIDTFEDGTIREYSVRKCYLDKENEL